MLYHMSIRCEYERHSLCYASDCTYVEMGASDRKGMLPTQVAKLDAIRARAAFDDLRYEIDEALEIAPAH